MFNGPVVMEMMGEQIEQDWARERKRQVLAQEAKRVQRGNRGRQPARARRLSWRTMPLQYGGVMLTIVLLVVVLWLNA